MSVDSYFCLCCLSTCDLMNLFGSTYDTNYVAMLTKICSVKVCQADCEDDSYICLECVNRLIDAHNFMTQVLQTLDVLQDKGLLNLQKSNDCVQIEKVSDRIPSEIALTDNVKEQKEEAFIDLAEDFDVKSDCLDLKPFTDELQDLGINIQIECLSTEFPAIKEEPEEKVPFDLPLVLEKEKRITVSKKFRQTCKKTIDNKLPLYTVNNTFTCDICTETLPNLNVYHKHMNKHFPNHICETCGKGFLSVKRLKRHMPSHQVKLFNCDTCEAVFMNYNTLNSHRQRKHKKDALYRCPFCEDRFFTFNKRVLHLAQVHGQTEKKYKCSMCPSTFLMSGNLSSHIRRKHKNIKRYFCSECDMGFFHKQDLSGHMPTHTGVKDFECAVCLKKYSRKKALDVHMKVHSNDRRFSCDACGKKFTQKCTLLSHLRVHKKKGGDSLKMTMSPPLVMGKQYGLYI